MKLVSRFIIPALLILSAVSCREHSDVLQANAASDYNDAHQNIVVPDAIVQGYAKISVSDLFSCAIYFGSLQCWGYNGQGQVGYGNLINQAQPRTIIREKVTDVAAGSFHACAVVDKGLKCWGYNLQGQLGNNTQVDSSSPVTVFPASSGVTKVAAGLLNTCAIVSGALYCWGDNNIGQMGDGTTSASPVLVPKMVISSGVTDVAVNENVVCAVVNSALKCWGENASGQIGDGTLIDSYVPKTIIASGVTKVVIAQSEGNFTCAIVSGALYCWGLNDTGNVGNGSVSMTPVKSPVKIISSGVTDVSANGAPCAVVNSAVYCWGTGNYNVAASVPTLFEDSLSAKSISGGHYNSCFISSHDELWCWGYNYYGSLGYGSLTAGYSEYPFQIFISPNF